MAQIPGGPINTAEYDDMQAPIKAIPPGKYIAKIISSRSQVTSAGNGEMLVLEFEVAAGPYKGSTFVTRLNLDNPSPMAVGIAQREFSTIVRACYNGEDRTIDDSDQLHHKAILVTLDVQKGTERYAPSNRATNYASIPAGMTEPPVNPEPDERMKAILAGEVIDQPSAPVGVPTPPSAPPAPPKDFAPPPPPASENPSPASEMNPPPLAKEMTPPPSKAPAAPPW